MYLLSIRKSVADVVNALRQNSEVVKGYFSFNEML